ncbi:hypothetical protein BDQ17DRAFT_1536058 [Cyathus striatus]|nr:hypothetical protein BDQ17DRAFT_1536058 [Cyathus striatus]
MPQYDIPFNINGSLGLEVDSSLHHGVESPGSSVFDLPTYTSDVRVRDTSKVSPLYWEENTILDKLRSASDASFIIISGGTGGNAICSAFENACYVLPVSDDGGSSSEIIRVLGGPSVGDIRSRLVRLIPPSPPSSPLDVIRKLLAYRLPADCSERQARDEWRDIVEGRSSLWAGVPNDRKETIRGFLVYFESELLKRAHKNFDFRNGSIGNYFLAAAHGFFRSLPSAIFLFSSITNSQANILPVIVTSHTVTIAAELENGERLVGQCEISHPVARTINTIDIMISQEPTSPTEGLDGFLSLGQNYMFEHSSKDEYESLSSRINRLFYINAYGMEIRPAPNPEYLSSLSSRDVLVYCCGSLWTSIIPCLSLRGVAGAIASSPRLRARILLLNSHNDRETEGYTALDYIRTISRTLNSNYHNPTHGLGNANTLYPASTFITDVVYLKGAQVQVEVAQITALGIRCTEMEGKSADGGARYDAVSVRETVNRILATKGTSEGC